MIAFALRQPWTPLSCANAWSSVLSSIASKQFEASAISVAGQRNREIRKASCNRELAARAQPMTQTKEQGAFQTMSTILKSASSALLISGRSARMSSFATEFLCSEEEIRLLNEGAFGLFNRIHRRRKNGLPCLCSPNGWATQYRCNLESDRGSTRIYHCQAISIARPKALCRSLGLDSQGSRLFRREGQISIFHR